MDVAFVSSGATSRAHYALVRKVESADTTELADQYLHAEVQFIRRKLSEPTLSTKGCRNALIMLLYCSMSVNNAGFARGRFDFALPHAVNLAEIGQSAHDKRIGYLFCAELMPPEHELRLMLVNTLRKDLESASLPHICLALDVLISAPTKEVVPAIQHRLHALLSHTSAHVRRRALLAFRALARHEPDLLARIAGETRRRVQDLDPGVSVAALALCGALADTVRRKFSGLVNALLASTWARNRGLRDRSLVLKALESLRVVGATPENMRLVLEIVQHASAKNDQALLYSGFLLLCTTPLESVNALQLTSDHLLVNDIQYLLASSDPNSHYAFLSCLESLDPSMWAGTTPAFPLALTPSEVERVMQFLDSKDGLVRRKTLKTLHRIDPAIVATYYTRLADAKPPAPSAGAQNEYIARLLEVVAVVAGEDGEAYAGELGRVLGVFEDVDPGFVSEAALEGVLSRVRSAGDPFRIACVGSILASAVVVDPPAAASALAGTYTVLLAALACEYAGCSSIAPIDVLRGLAARLSASPAPVQDALVLSMLRVSADCGGDVPLDVSDAVRLVRQGSRRHLRRRCDQFLELSGQRDVLAAIVARASSSSLPDFLQSLETHHTPTPSAAASRPGSTTPSQSHSPTPSSPQRRLRYAAYAAPRPTASLRRPSGGQRSMSGSSDREGSVVSRANSGEGGGHVTPGDLTLAAADGGLEVVVMRPRREEGGAKARSSPLQDLSSRVDLIAFDSPFVSDPFEDRPPPL